MHGGKLNNIWCNDLGKPMKQTSFRVKKPRENDPKRNNPLYQIEIYNQEYQFVVNLITVTKLSFEPLRFLWCGLVPTWISSLCLDLQYAW